MKKMALRRGLAALFVIAIMVFSLAFHSGLGTPSAVGVGPFFLLCPLGGLEALVASKTLIPQAIISFLVVAAVCLTVGRAWCAWGCPAHGVRHIFGSREAHQDEPVARISLKETLKADSRLWVLAGFLIAACVVALPVFCLVCPIGLTFGTIMSLWRLVQFNDVNWGLVVFPLALVIELVIFKKWCLKICPIGGLLSLFGRFAKPFRPVVNESTCLHARGVSCQVCHDVCIEGIRLHEGPETQGQLADCTRCARCMEACPSGSITMPFRQPPVQDDSGSPCGGEAATEPRSEAAEERAEG